MSQGSQISLEQTASTGRLSSEITSATERHELASRQRMTTLFRMPASVPWRTAPEAPYMTSLTSAARL